MDNPDFHALFKHRIGRLKRCAAIRESLKNIVRHCRAFRVNLRDPLDFSAEVMHRQLPDGLITRVHQWARKNGGSVNDAFLTALAQTMGRYTAAERYKHRKRWFHLQRTKVGLGTIVDIRDAASKPLDQTFGLYLSSYTVVLDKPEQRTADQLFGEIATSTARMKETFATVRGRQRAGDGGTMVGTLPAR